MKKFNLQYNIGKAKYCIAYQDGVSTHNDGSPFWGLKTFKNKILFNQEIKTLKTQGYYES